MKMFILQGNIDPWFTTLKYSEAVQCASLVFISQGGTQDSGLAILAERLERKAGQWA